MKGLRDANQKKLPKLSSYMLKTVLLHQLDLVDWQQDLGTLLVAMWAQLVNHLGQQNLPFFFGKWTQCTLSYVPNTSSQMLRNC